MWRDGGERTLDGEDRRGARRARGPAARADRAAAPRPSSAWRCGPITPEVARQLNLRTSEGVIVARVDEGSPAAEAGIQRGDVIREINRQKIRTPADYERITRDAKEGDRLTVLLQRGPMSLYVAFTVGKG